MLCGLHTLLLLLGFVKHDQGISQLVNELLKLGRFHSNATFIQLIPRLFGISVLP